MTEASKTLDLELAQPVEIPVPRKSKDAVDPQLILGKLRLLWEERRFLWRFTGGSIVFALAVALLIPPQFESTARLMPPDNQSTAGMAMLASMSAKGGAGLGTLAGDLLGLKSSGELFVGILQSRTVQDRLIERFDLRKVYGQRLWQGARKKLASNTVISDDRKNGIITITVTDRDPRRAAAMAEAYVTELNRLVAELSTSGAHRERVFLEDRLKTVQLELEEAEKDFSQYASKNMAIDIKEQGKAMVEAAATLQGRLIAAQSELEGLRQIYADNSIRVRSVEAQVSELKYQLNKVGGKQEATSNQAASSKDSLYPSIKELPLLGVTYADMYRRTKVEEAIFEALTQQYELAKVQEVKETPSVKVLDPANIPERKSFPPRTVIVLAIALLSCACSIAWVLGKSRWYQMDSDDPLKVVALGVYEGARAHLDHAAQNGSRLGWMVRHARRFRRPSNPTTTQSKTEESASVWQDSN